MKDETIEDAFQAQNNVIDKVVECAGNNLRNTSTLIILVCVLVLFVFVLSMAAIQARRDITALQEFHQDSPTAIIKQEETTQ